MKMFGRKRKVLLIGVGAIGTFDQCKCSKKRKVLSIGVGVIETFDQCNLNIRKKGSLEGEWVLSKHSINVT